MCDGISLHSHTQVKHAALDRVLAAARTSAAACATLSVCRGLPMAAGPAVWRVCPLHAKHAFLSTQFVFYVHFVHFGVPFMHHV